MIRIGFIGTGYATPVSDWHTKGFLRDGRAVFTAVYNRTQESGENWAKRSGQNVVLCTSVEELLENCDAVLIATPNQTHYTYAKMAIEAGKHVLLEKPMALTADQSKELYQLALEAKVFCCVGYVYRYSEAVLRLKEIIRENMGEIYTIQASFGGTRLANPQVGMEWRMYESLSGSGALHDFGSHVIDMLHFVTGEKMTQVSCISDIYIEERMGKNGPERVETDDASCLNFRSGHAVGQMLLSRVGLGPMKIQISGQGGMVSMSMGENSSVIFQPKEKDGGYNKEPIQTFVPEEITEDWFYAQAADFLDGIEGKTVQSASFSDGFYVDKILSMAKESAGMK